MIYVLFKWCFMKFASPVQMLHYEFLVVGILIYKFCPSCSKAVLLSLANINVYYKWDGILMKDKWRKTNCKWELGHQNLDEIWIKPESTIGNFRFFSEANARRFYSGVGILRALYRLVLMEGD